MDSNIDRFVLDFHACDTQTALNAFWDSVPAGMEDAIIDRLNELFPPQPTVCDSDPFAQRVRMIERGMSEHEAAFFVSLLASGCASRNVQDHSCDVCAAFVDLYKPEYLD